MRIYQCKASDDGLTIDKWSPPACCIEIIFIERQNIKKVFRKGMTTEKDRLDHEQENSSGEFDKIKFVFEKKIQFCNRFLTEGDLTELDRLMLSNKKEWIMSHLLSLILEEENTNKFSELTKRVYEQERKTVELEEY